MDRAIAEKVFGLDPLNARHGMHADGDLEYYWGYPVGHSKAPAYSTDQNAAMGVVDKIINLEGIDTCTLDLCGLFPGSGDSPHWEAMFSEFWGGRLGVGVGDSPSEAICNAALNVMLNRTGT